LDVQNRAAALKLRAERRAGELLSEAGFGKQGGDRKSSCTLQLDSFGVEKTQSHRWQKLASLPEDEFETYIDETVEAGKELTTAGALRLAKSAAKPRGGRVVIEPDRPEPNEWDVVAAVRDAIDDLRERFSEDMRPVFVQVLRDIADEIEGESEVTGGVL
jgi:hypothetical protein